MEEKIDGKGNEPLIKSENITDDEFEKKLIGQSDEEISTNKSNEDNISPIKIQSSENINKPLTEEEIKKNKRIAFSKKMEEINKNKDFYSNANYFSRLIYYWAYKMIKLAKKVNLNSKHLGKLIGTNSSLTFINKTYYVYNTLDYKSARRCSLFKTILRANLNYVISVVLLALFITGLNVLSINLFRLYIKQFNDDSITRDFKFLQIIGFSFLGCKLILVFASKQLSEYMNFIGFKSSIELNCLIFDKVLKSSPSSTKEMAESGEILNFVQVDSHKLTMLMMQSPTAITIPIMIIAYSYMLFKFLGWNFIFGLVVLIFFVFLNFLLMRKFKRHQKLRQKRIDDRLKVTTETLFNLKVLKLYSWENYFLDKIYEKREEELKEANRIFQIQNLNRTLLWFSPVATAVVSIGTYVYFTNEVRVEDIFTCLGILSSIQEPIRMIAMIYANLLDSLISMKRIEKFLAQDDIIEENLIKNDEESINNGFDIIIKNCDFSWGMGKKAEKKEEEEKKKDKGKKKGKEEEKKIEETKNGENEEKKEENNENIENKNEDDKNEDKKEEEKKEEEKKEDEIQLDKDDKNEEEKKEEEIQNDENQIEDDNLRAKNTEIPSEKKIEEISTSPETQSSKSLLNQKIPIILHDINLFVKKGEFICIIGEVGSGKSTLLNAILNNLLQINRESKQSELIVNGSISYTSQVAWIQNTTLRNNILFHKEYEQEKYDKILEISELKPDLEILEGGDQTEIGEKGINLSGGQKARISIARALYADSDIYLFDDPISALDANVGKNVINNCICDYLKYKTRILVTHAIQYAHHADRIIYMKDGKITWEGTFEEITHQKFWIAMTLKRKSSRSKSGSDLGENNTDNSSNEEEERKEEEEEVIEEQKKIKKENVKRITREEDRVTGSLKTNANLLYIRAIGGAPIAILLILFLIIWQAMKGGSDLWLAFWTKENKKFDFYYFGIYAGLGLGSTLFTYFRLLLISAGSIRNSRNLHRDMVSHLIRAPINLYHDTVPKGQILNRLSKDLFKIDVLAQMSFGNLTTYIVNFLGEIIICSIFQWYSLIFLPILLVFGLITMQFYLNCSRELSRLEGIVRSPVINSLNETISGRDTIRAYGLANDFTLDFRSRVDEFLKLRIFINGTSQWFCLMLDLLSFCFVCFLIIFTLYFSSFEVQIIAILLTYCIQLQDDLIRYLVSRSNFENDMTGQERCLYYTTIRSELPNNMPIDETLTNWPSEGKIEFRNFSVKYRPDTEIVLRNISFSIEGGEKIGIVGRTGSGKSTIALCLFRILEPLEGTIFIDDVNITEIGLSKLRASITIIPQDPTLMEGSLKFNIDPLNLHSREEIADVMQKIGFWYICERYVNESDDPLINNPMQGLDMVIKENGTNISIGEKQLICITRAILRKSKIVVMDEATASIDVATEKIIQSAINELLTNSTVMTIAHRIKTIIKSDKILVLEKGEIAEFDDPQTLLENKNSLFYELYSKSNL